MNQIILNVDNQHIADFLVILNNLNYVEIKKVNKENSTLIKSATRPNASVLLEAAKPPRTAVTLAQLAQEQGYVKTNWLRLRQLADTLDIQEPIEDLLTQLNE
jgi:hypothetical protein